MSASKTEDTLRLDAVEDGIDVAKAGKVWVAKTGPTLVGGYKTVREAIDAAMRIMAEDESTQDLSPERSF